MLSPWCQLDYYFSLRDTSSSLPSIVVLFLPHISLSPISSPSTSRALWLGAADIKGESRLTDQQITLHQNYSILFVDSHSQLTHDTSQFRFSRARPILGLFLPGTHKHPEFCSSTHLISILTLSTSQPGKGGMKNRVFLREESPSASLPPLPTRPCPTLPYPPLPSTLLSSFSPLLSPPLSPPLSTPLTPLSVITAASEFITSVHEDLSLFH